MQQYRFGLIVTILTVIIALLQFRQQPAVLATYLASGLLSWYLTQKLLPKTRDFMMIKKIFGHDINKKGSEAGEKEIPECMGFASAVSFCMVMMLEVALLSYLKAEKQLTLHLAVLVTVLGTILLGFADDMLDLLWRYKLLFPFFIILPLVSIYSGVRHFEVIFPFSLVFGDKLYLGPFYLLYIVCLGIYKTNTINIFAGINGLEVGQSIVAASSMLLYFGLEVIVKGTSALEISQYSIWLLLVFLGGALALLKLNQYPSQIFIGDTFCYFAGIVLAIAAILGEIPVVCHWFIVPQLINFLYSTPQLFGFKECPRHRLAKYDPKTDLLHPIPTNMNLLNLALRVLGPTNEGSLCLKLLIFQGTFSLIPIGHLLLS